MKLNKLFTQEEHEQLNQAIAEAEKNTSAELVPLVTDMSAEYHHSLYLFGFLFSLISLTTLWFFTQGLSLYVTWYSQDQSLLDFDLLSILAFLILGFGSGVIIADRIDQLRYWFTSKKEMKAQVLRGAQRAFLLHKVGDTRGRTGVLIYISLFERMVHVMGDQAIVEKFNDDDFEEVKDLIVAGFAQHKAKAGLAEAIQATGLKLSEHFPRQPEDDNELINEIILFEFSI